MTLPIFTPDEQYLIDAVKSPKAASGSASYMWSYIIGGGLVAAFAAYHENVLMLAAAFVVVVGFRIYEERFQNRWLPLWRSILEKYEAACSTTTPDETVE